MELKFLLLTSLFYFDVLGDHECGISYTQEVPTSYTINKRHQIGMWPWAVSMHFNGQKLCSGVIISPRYVLTAAHCYNDAMLSKETKRRHFSIHAGTVYANEGEVVRVKNVTTYDGRISKDVENDIALLELERPLEFSENISNICLPQYYEEFPGENAFVAGFGNVLDEDTDFIRSNEMLNDVVINFQKFDFCQKASQTWNYNSTNYVCGGAKMKGSATGDSGGPLMVKERVYQNGELKSRWFAVGTVVGGGLHPEGNTNEDQEGNSWSRTLFARISFYCDWIKNITNDEATCYEIPSQPKPKSASRSCFDKEKRQRVCQNYRDKKVCNNPRHKQYSDARYNCAKTCGVCKI